MSLRAEYRPFHEPWHAQIFALTVHLNEQGHFEWKDWSNAISAVSYTHLRAHETDS